VSARVKWAPPAKVVQLVTIGIGLYALDADGDMWWQGAGGQGWEPVETPRQQEVRRRKRELARLRRGAK
jgi:hypothetical protein